MIGLARERESEPRFHFLVGPCEIPLTPRIISDRERLDVATLKLTQGEVATIEHVLDPEYTVRNIVDVSAPERTPAFEGFSGGPAFVVPPDELLVVPHLCGIVKEGGVSELVPGRIVLYYARIHRLERSGVIG